ncbi:hypothetical protein V8E53_000918 [Lactarius tabidus]
MTMTNFSVHCQEIVGKWTLTLTKQVYTYLDIEAAVDNNEEEELSDGEIDRFLKEDDATESMSDWNVRPGLPAINTFIQDAEEMQALVTSRQIRPAFDILKDNVPQRYLVPRDFDPLLWAIHIKMGYETSLIYQIYCWAMDEQSLRPHIMSAFTRDGLPGYIFVEAQQHEVMAVMVTLVTILNSEPYLVPSDHCIALLKPQSSLIQEGKWVQCLQGLYHSNYRFVCRYSPLSELDLLITFILRIPEPSPWSTKQKRVAWLVAHTWSALEIEAVWGPSRIQKKSGDEFVFRHKDYSCSLLMKHLSSEVESGEQKGIIRHPFAINNSVATIIRESEEESPPFNISMHYLSPLYLPGDNVKARWSDLHGMVILVDEDQNWLVYIDVNLLKEIKTPVDAVKPFEPLCHYYRFKEGVWVNFCQSMDHGDHTQRGYIKGAMDMHTTIIDECTFTEKTKVNSLQFNIDMHDLEICKIQGLSLPKNDPIHPLVNQRILVTRGPSKGLYGCIKEVGSEAMSVKLEAKVASSTNLCQPMKWTDLTLVPKTVNASRLTTVIRTQAPTPPPDMGPRSLVILK